MPKPMMKCGHAANSEGPNGPACVICALLDPGAMVVDDNPPSLEGRQAKCAYCGKLEPSDPQVLAFFEYRGANSREATETCGNCGYHYVAHSHEARAKNPSLNCFDFVPRGAWEYDLHYCGCRGWD